MVVTALVLQHRGNRPAINLYDHNPQGDNSENAITNSTYTAYNGLK
jgi:hypothetical protein